MARFNNMSNPANEIAIIEAVTNIAAVLNDYGYIVPSLEEIDNDYNALITFCEITDMAAAELAELPTDEQAKILVDIHKTMGVNIVHELRVLNNIIDEEAEFFEKLNKSIKAAKPTRLVKLCITYRGCVLDSEVVEVPIDEDLFYKVGEGDFLIKYLFNVSHGFSCDYNKKAEEFYRKKAKPIDDVVSRFMKILHDNS